MIGGAGIGSRMRIWLAFLVLLVAALPAAAQRGDEVQALAEFAARLGLRDVAAFVEAVQTLRRERHLPPRYVGKDQARERGWRGGGLCAVWPEHIIGGDPFGNFERQLPAAAGRRWREADLDPNCRERGAKRLLFSNDGLILVTVDHYKTFVPVP